MADLKTRQTLLWRIRDPEDQAAWEEFVEIYAPVIYHFTVGRGLAPADAADIVQEVMKSLAGAMKSFEYEPDKGTFRSWLFTIVRNQIASHFRYKSRRLKTTGRTTAMKLAEAQSLEEGDENVWDREYRKQMFAWAAAKVRPEFGEATWSAFWRTAVLDEDATQVAEELGLSKASVYVAKSRAVKRIRETIAAVADDRWEADLV
jgi:RNA polymerase sigma-70 factor (ECF subfamily)